MMPERRLRAAQANLSVSFLLLRGVHVRGVKLPFRQTWAHFSETTNVLVAISLPLAKNSTLAFPVPRAVPDVEETM